MDRATLDTRLGPGALDAFDLDAADRPPVEAAFERAREAVAAEAGLTDTGRARIAAYVDKHLRKLASLAADRARYPEIASIEIARPIVIMGAPRSGTTFLHSLLAQDPQFRSPLTWEVEFPSPPPENAHLLDDRRVALWAERQSQAGATVGRDLRDKDLLRKHLIGATLPEECGIMLGAMLRSPSGFWTLARLAPYYRWLIDSQMDEAMGLHRRWLQHLQWRAPRPYWLLKYPLYTFAIDALKAAYPSALLIETHRNPAETVSSFASLMTTLRTGALAAEDPACIGREMLAAQAEGAERSMAWRDRQGVAAIEDVGYADLLRDPMRVVGRLYDRLGLTFTAVAEARMATFLAETPQGKHGEHHHALASFGLTEGEIRSRMSTYLVRFEELLEHKA